MKIGTFLRKILPPWRKKGFTSLTEAREALSMISGVSDITLGSLVMPAILWLGKQVSTIPLMVLDESDEEVTGAIADTLLRILKQRLLFAFTTDYALHGNAYAEILRAGDGSVSELRYIAPAWVTPMAAAGSLEPAYYRVAPPRVLVRELAPEDVLHVTQGIDPTNPMLGLSPFKALTNDIQVDSQTGKILEKFLSNGALMSLILSPKVGDGISFDQETAKAASDDLSQRFSGDLVGKPLVAGTPYDVHTTIGDFQKLAMKDIRHQAEERVAATIGIPAAVVGYGAGLETTKVGATLRVMQASAWENAVLPSVNALLDGVNEQVVPDVRGGLRISYNLPRGHVSETSAEALTESTRNLYDARIISLQESRERIGMPAEVSGDLKPPGSEPGEETDERQEDEATEDE